MVMLEYLSVLIIQDVHPHSAEQYTINSSSLPLILIICLSNYALI